MAGLSDLDFQPGLRFQELVKARFGVSVSPISSSFEFLLVASFSRSAIRLDANSVSLILQSCLGRVAQDFHVSWLQGWSFCFRVSCKSVGIMIHHLKTFVDKLLSLHFTLWRHGGPDWRKELVNLGSFAGCGMASGYSF
jgi:hypothetical protein